MARVAMNVAAGLPVIRSPFERQLSATAQHPLTRERARVTGIDIDDVARGFRRPIGREIRNGFGDVLWINAALQQAALTIHRLEFIGRRLVLLCTLLCPFALPDA